MDSMGILKPPVYNLRCMITWPCVSPPTWLLEFSAVPYLVRSGYILLYPDCVKVGKLPLWDNENCPFGWVGARLFGWVGCQPHRVKKVNEPTTVGNWVN